MKIIQWLLLLSLFLYGQTSYSQDGRIVRVEIEAAYDADNYYIVPVGKTGVILFNPTNSRDRSSTSWTFTCYNTDFSELWKLELNVPRYHSYVGHSYSASQQAIYVLFARKIGNKEGGSFYIEKTYFVAKLDLKLKDFFSLSGNLDEEMVVADYCVHNNTFWFGGYNVLPLSKRNLKLLGCYCGLGIPLLFGIDKYIPHAQLYSINFDSGKSTKVNLSESKHSLVRSITSNDKTGMVDLLLEERKDKKSYEAYLLQLTENAVIKEKIPIPLEKGREINQCKIIPVNPEQNLIFGLFTNEGKYKVSVQEADNPYRESYGILAGIIEGGRMVFSKYYAFSELENTFKYLGQKLQYRFERKRARAGESGRKYSLSYNLLLHDIIHHAGSYICIAEAYYPEYHRVCNSYFDMYGRYYEDCFYIFDGYRFTHAIITNFDSQGRLIWDNTFEIGDVLSNELKERVRVFPEKDELVVFYSNNGKLRSKTIKGNEISGDVEVMSIETLSENDKVKENYSGNVEYWYDKYFIAYGIQKIANDRSTSKKKTRTVFYFNKLQLN